LLASRKLEQEVFRMKSMIRDLLLAALLVFPLAACNQTAAPPPPASVSVMPSGLQMPGGSGCKGEVDR
jgi:hypothetical protein